MSTYCEYVGWLREAPALLSVVLSIPRHSLCPGTDTHLQAMPSSSSASSLSAQPEHHPSLQHPGKSFPGKSACQWDPSFMEICQKGKFQFPPQNRWLTAELCNASRSHFREQLLSTKHNFSMNGNSTERTTAPTRTSPCSFTLACL